MPHIDRWTATSLPTFGIVLERPADWQAVAGYGDPEIGETRFAGVDGFVHVSAMNGDSIDDSPDGTHLAWVVKEGVAEDGSSDWTGVAVFDLAAHTAQILHPPVQPRFHPSVDDIPPSRLVYCP